MQILLFVLVVLAVVGFPLFLAGRQKRDRGQPEMALVGVAKTEAGMQLWVTALRRSGIQAEIRNIGDILAGDLSTPGGAGPNAWEYEVWVRAKDDGRARKALGLNGP